MTGRTPSTERATAWPVEEIATTLAGELTQPAPGLWAISLPNRVLGTTIEVLLCPDHGALQLTPERDKRTGPWVLGQIVYYGIRQVRCDPNERRVLFSIDDHPPHVVEVTALGQFRVVYGRELHRLKLSLPAAELDEIPRVTLEGELFRPSYLVKYGRPLWLAGLRQELPGQAQPLWHRLKAVDKLAREAAEHFGREQPVRVTGRFAEERFRQDGTWRVIQTLYLERIDPI